MNVAILESKALALALKKEWITNMALIEIPEQTISSEIDEDIIEIFIEEVEEVLENILTSFKVWKIEPNDSESLTTLRRSFHTLKGSGRLVGATAIGELGWHFENMLNQVLKGSLTPSPDLQRLIEQVGQILPEMVKCFQNNQRVSDEIILLISQANYLAETKSSSLVGFDATLGPATETSQPQSASISEPVLSHEEINNIQENKTDLENELIAENDDLLSHSDSLDDLETDDINFNDLDQELEGIDSDLNDEELILLESNLQFEDELSELETERLDDSGDEELAQLETDNLLDSELETESLPEADLERRSEENLKLNFATTELSQDDDIEAHQQLIEIFKQEAKQQLIQLHQILAQLNQNLPAQIETDLVRIFHTLNGSSVSVDFLSVSKLAAPLENYTRTLQEQKILISQDILELFQDASQLLEKLVNEQPLEQTQLQALLTKLQVSLEALRSSSSQNKVNDVPQTEEEADATDEFIEIFLEEAEGILDNLQSLLERWQISPDDMQLMKELQRDLHTLKGGARMVGIVPMGDLSHNLEDIFKQIVEGTAKSNSQLQEIVQNSVDELHAMVEAVHAKVEVEMPTELLNKIKDVSKIVNDSQPKFTDIEREIKTALDESVLEESESEASELSSLNQPPEEVIFFLEEAEEIINNTQSLLERWQASPDDTQLMKELYRDMHTLKGGARMMKITQMGDLSHTLEDVLERIVKHTLPYQPQLQEIVQDCVDELDEMR